MDAVVIVCVVSVCPSSHWTSNSVQIRSNNLVFARTSKAFYWFTWSRTCVCVFATAIELIRYENLILITAIRWSVVPCARTAQAFAGNSNSCSIQIVTNALMRWLNRRNQYTIEQRMEKHTRPNAECLCDSVCVTQRIGIKRNARECTRTMQITSERVNECLVLWHGGPPKRIFDFFSNVLFIRRVVEFGKYFTFTCAACTITRNKNFKFKCRFFLVAAILQRSTVGVGQIRLIGIATCLYLCMDACGNLYGSVCTAFSQLRTKCFVYSGINRSNKSINDVHSLCQFAAMFVRDIFLELEWSKWDESVLERQNKQTNKWIRGSCVWMRENVAIDWSIEQKICVDERNSFWLFGPFKHNKYAQNVFWMQ